jgi:hypothetical protein
MHSFCLLIPFLFMWFAVHTPGGADGGGVTISRKKNILLM